MIEQNILCLLIIEEIRKGNTVEREIIKKIHIITKYTKTKIKQTMNSLVADGILLTLSSGVLFYKINPEFNQSLNNFKKFIYNFKKAKVVKDIGLMEMLEDD